MKKLLLYVVLASAIFGGTFTAWKNGYVHQAWYKGRALVTSTLGGQPAEEPTQEEIAARLQQPTRGQNLLAMVAPQLVQEQPAAAAPVAASGQPASQPATSIRPPATTVSMPQQPVDNSPIDVASLSGNAPRMVSTVASGFVPPQQVAAPQPAQSQVRQAPVQSQPSAQQQLQAQVMARQSQPVTQVSQQATIDSAVAVTPVLSDAKAQIRAVDQILGSNPTEAMKRLNDLLMTRLEPDDAAEAGYRKGYAARMLQDEATAERAWRETSDAYPTLRGGRYSSLAMGDTLYHRYAGDRSQLSFWDDISLMYSRALGRDDAPFLPPEVRATMKTKLKRINDQLFFGAAPSKLARYHRVESGELLGSIAGKYRVDYESIARINGINPNRIRVGMDLKLIVGDVDVVVRKNNSDRNTGPSVTWFLDGRWVREYSACVGEGMKTPAGTYNFTSKERDPSWTNPANGQLLPNAHPENILGSRWMAMKGMNTQGLGIHGTTVHDSIPGYTSAGCVRLLNTDVEELFSFARIGGRVTIID